MRDDWRDELFMFYSEWQVGMRTDRYKYITSIKEEGHIELYDLQEDPKELQTVHADPAYSDVLTDMQQRLEGLMEDNKWTKRIHTPIRKLLVSSPINRADADRLALASSTAAVPTTDAVDDNGLSWRLVDRGIDRFDIGQGVPA